MEERSSLSGRSDRIFKLLNSQKSRAGYIKAKLSVLVPAQIRALRIRSTNPPMPKQTDLARESEMHQSRISMFETPGAANVTLETLSKIAAGLRCGIVVKFVPFTDMLRWENSFRPDVFDVRRLTEDEDFLTPDAPVELNSVLGSFYRGDSEESGADVPLLTDGQGYKKPTPNEQDGFYWAQGA